MSFHRRADDGASVALPITPMLDMSFQLLFFFIAAFQLPTGMEGQMPLTLAGEKIDDGPRPTPADDDPLLREDLTVVLTSDDSGRDPDGVGGLTLQSRSGVTSMPYSRDLAELREGLAGSVDKGIAPRLIRVRGDGKVKWRGVVRVLDACRRAGFEDVAFAEANDGSR